ncbi:MAG: VOC family protein [Angustibacter sp.]
MEDAEGDVTLRPVRFTADVRAGAQFARLLGLARRVESSRGGWVELVAGGGGMLALHDARTSASRQPSGRTTLSAECDDADALAARLKDAGYPDATVYDEAYGRVLVVTDPDGAQVAVDERATDLHGYREHDTAAADPRWRVRVTVRSADPAAYRAFAQALGVGALVDVVEGAPQVAPSLGPDGAQHRAAVVELVLVSGEPLADVEARLRDAGHDDAIEGDDDALQVVDPDGVRLVVRAGQVPA